jgi:hypothetical protein
VEEGVLRIGLEALLGGLQLADRDAVERPAMSGRDVPQLLLDPRRSPDKAFEIVVAHFALSRRSKKPSSRRLLASAMPT